MLNLDDAREAAAALRTGELVKELDQMDFMEGALERVSRLLSEAKKGGHVIGVAGSPRFGVYGVDFGWGKPRKVEIVSADRTGAISMVESRDGSGGIEISLALKKHQMDVFSPLFLASVET